MPSAAPQPAASTGKEREKGMTRIRRNLIAALGVAALAVPSAALAGQGENHGHSGESHGNAAGHAGNQDVAYVFRGTYEGGSTVSVAHGNARVRKDGLVGQTVSFDLTAARITVADTNGDGATDLGDVQVGDKVLVKAMLPKSDPGSQPFAAKRLVDQTQPTE